MRSELDTIDHVLRGALNTILLNLQLLVSSFERDEQARPLLDQASSEVRRLATELLPAAFRIVSLEINELRAVDLGRLVEQIRAEHGLGGAAVGSRRRAGGDRRSGTARHGHRAPRQQRRGGHATRGAPSCRSLLT